jgi:hypothetical protein
MTAVPTPIPATSPREKYNGGEHVWLPDGLVVAERVLEEVVCTGGGDVVVAEFDVGPESVTVTVGSVIGTTMTVETEPMTALPLASNDNVAGIATTLENVVSLRGNAGAVGTGNDESGISVTIDC